MSMIDVKGRKSGRTKYVRSLPKKKVEGRKSSAVEKARRGASQKAQRDQKPPFDFSKLLKFIKQGSVVVSVCLAVTVALYFGRELVNQASSRPISNIGIEGKFVYIDKNDVSELIAPMIQSGFLQMPLSVIKETLESNPWIDSALVSRRWPDTLYVAITEQEPIARWSQTGFLNTRGEVVFVEQTDALHALPLLAGDTMQAKQIMQDFQELTQLLRPYDLAVKEFYCDELNSWSVVLDNDIVITIGRDQIMDKVQRFLTVYATSLESQIDLVAGVDLRYGNGVAVKWKEAELLTALQQSALQ